VFNNICGVYADLGEKQNALDCYDQTLPLIRAIGDKSDEAKTLNNIGKVYDNLGAKQKALNYFSQALLLSRAIGDTDDEATTLSNMMYVWNSLDNRRMAVFYGKQSINKHQELRQSIQGLDNETQKSFLRCVKCDYQGLAESLIEDGQLAQAVQALNLYQDQQFFDFDRNPNEPAKQIALSQREATLAARYEQASEKVGQIGGQIEELKRRIGKRQPDGQEATERKQLESSLTAASETLLAVLKDAEAEFSKPRDEQDIVPTASDVIGLQTTLRDLSATTKQKTVALYTLIGEKQFCVLLVTPEEIKPFVTPIKSSDFNQTIVQFYGVLRSPDRDPRPLGKKLYEIILGPVAAELKRNGAQTLLWSLDSSLRYVPMAALSPDGTGYLVEQYQNVVFTRTNRERMMRAGSHHWTGTGFGSSRAQKVKWFDTELSFSALPGVTTELQSIFGSGPNSKGILTGMVFTDSQFTKAAMYLAMQARRPLVHISSHFAFRPGDDSISFLLLGDGTALPLNELKKEGRLFDGVELLTLSACNTAAQRANADGREIDGFAELAQRLGAGAVMATLWSVSDNSTPYLMSDFYRLRQQQAGTTKAAALRQAQLALLNGTAKVKPVFNQGPATKGASDATLKIVLVPTGGQRDTNQSRDTEEVIYVDQKDAPLYQRGTAKPYAHPYYWAPFVLFGNWK
jgi:CHAT domain-containing protein